MADSDAQRTDYSSKKGEAAGKSKLLSSGRWPGGQDKAGSAGGNSGTGPTGSPRSYPKGGGPSLDAGRLNPQTKKPTDWVVGGV